MLNAIEILLVVTLVVIAYMAMSMYNTANTDPFCNCSNFGTRKVSRPTYHNYSQLDNTTYGARGMDWPVGSPYDVYSMRTAKHNRRRARAMASKQCGDKYTVPKTGYSTVPIARGTASTPMTVNTPLGCELPMLTSDGPSPVDTFPAGSFESPAQADGSSCTQASPYNLRVGVL